MSFAHRSFTHWFAVTSLACTVAACGGGGEDASTTPIGRADATTQAGGALDQDCGIAGVKEQMLAAVNQARAQGQQCGGVWQPPVQGLSWHPALGSTAEAHSNDMATHNFVAHTGTDGSMVADRASAQGYASGVGENLGGGQTSVSHLMGELIASPAHCTNLMRPDYQYFGGACTKNEASLYKRHWTQVFGQ